MTIDEYIALAREMSEQQRYYADFEKNNLSKQCCLNSAKENEQLAEWLEELKVLRHEANELRNASYEHGHSVGYNKAIDDFADKFISLCDDGEFMARLNEFPATTILDLSEQLKAGGEM